MQLTTLLLTLSVTWAGVTPSASPAPHVTTCAAAVPDTNTRRPTTRDTARSFPTDTTGTRLTADTVDRVLAVLRKVKAAISDSQRTAIIDRLEINSDLAAWTTTLERTPAIKEALKGSGLLMSDFARLFRALEFAGIAAALEQQVGPAFATAVTEQLKVPPQNVAVVRKYTQELDALGLLPKANMTTQPTDDEEQ